MNTKRRVFVLGPVALWLSAFLIPNARAAAPAALFEVDVLAGKAPLPVRFMSKSTGTIDSYEWDFDYHDENGDSTLVIEDDFTVDLAGPASATNTYTNPGRYEAVLKVANASGYATVKIYIRVLAADYVPACTTYYVDATGGNDSNPGTSASLPKKTLNSISRPDPGDTILFKRGEVWESEIGEALYLRESGLPGYPITYGAYGDSQEDLPRIRRQARVPNWSNAGVWSNLSFREANSFEWKRNSSTDTGGPMNSRSFIPANYLSQDGNRIRITVGGHATLPVDIASAWIGEQASCGDIYDMASGTVAQITFGGNASVTIAANGTEDSDWMDYDFDHTRDYIISLGIGSAARGLYASGEWYETSYYSIRDAVGDAGHPDATAPDYHRLLGLWSLAGFGIDTDATGATGRVWCMDCTFQDPQRVWLSGTEYGTPENRGRLNPVYRWMHEYHASGPDKFYVYAEDNPASAFTSMELAGLYGSPVTWDTKDHIVFRDLDLQGGRGTTLSIDGSRNILIEDCRIGFGSGTHGIKVARSTCGRSSSAGIIRNNVVDSGNHVANYWHAETTDDGISLATGANGWLVCSNVVHGWAHTGMVIENFEPDSYTTSSNRMFGNLITCPDIEYGRGFGGGNVGATISFEGNEFCNNIMRDTKTRSQIGSGGIKFYNNIVDEVNCQIRDNIAQGLMIYDTHCDLHDLLIFNNLFVNTDHAGLWYSGNNVKNLSYHDNGIGNNILHNTGRLTNGVIYSRDGGPQTPAVGFQLIIEDMHSTVSMLDHGYQNNLLYRPGVANPVYYGTDPGDNYPKSAEAFNAMDGTAGDTISGNVSGEPLFVNAAGRDYGPEDLSPVIDAGAVVDPGRTRDFLGNPVYGAPDIGPIEYQPPYRMGVDGVDVAGNVRVYADGKFRNTAAPAGTTVQLAVEPEGGFPANDYSEWMNIAVSNWSVTAMAWTESWVTASNTAHTLGGLLPDTDYDIRVNGVLGFGLTNGTIRSSPLGALAFLYAGGCPTSAFEVTATDGDTLPDGWEEANWGNTDQGDDGDPDGDGLNNREEYVAGTDPALPAGTLDVFELTIGGTGETVAVSFPARKAEGAGYGGMERYYSLEAATGLTAAAWGGVDGLTNVAGTNQTVRYSVPATNGAPCLYRGRVWLE